MDKNNHSKKDHDRVDYKQFKVTCRICLGIGKRKSKSFNNLYALKRHLTTTHDRQDEITSGITRKKVLRTVRTITTALDWNMFVDLHERRHL